MSGVHMSRHWYSERHLVETLAYCFNSPTNLSYLQVPHNGEPNAKEQLVVDRLVAVVWDLMRERVWSLAARHSLPPESYAGIFSRVRAEQKRTAVDMQRHWRNFILLEQHRFADADSKMLWEDCKVPLVVRVMYCFFERDKFESRSRAGIRRLRGCLQCLPDQKGTEELHHHVTFFFQTKRNVEDSHLVDGPSCFPLMYTLCVSFLLCMRVILVICVIHPL